MPGRFAADKRRSSLRPSRVTILLIALSNSYKSFFELMARPKVTPSEKRSVKITFRVTEKQQQKLLLLAKACGTTPGDLVRTKLFRGHFPATSLPKIDEDTYIELKKIGVNLNQLTKHANSGRLPIGIDKTLAALLRQEEKIIRLLLRDDSRSEDR